MTDNSDGYAFAGAAIATALLDTLVTKGTLTAKEGVDIISRARTGVRPYGIVNAASRADAVLESLQEVMAKRSRQ